MKYKKTDNLVNYFRFVKKKLTKEDAVDLILIALSGVDWKRIMWQEGDELKDEELEQISNAMDFMRKSYIWIEDDKAEMEKHKRLNKELETMQSDMKKLLAIMCEEIKDKDKPVMKKTIKEINRQVKKYKLDLKKVIDTKYGR